VSNLEHFGIVVTGCCAVVEGALKRLVKALLLDQDVGVCIAPDFGNHFFTVRYRVRLLLFFIGLNRNMVPWLDPWVLKLIFKKKLVKFGLLGLQLIKVVSGMPKRFTLGLKGSS
jgi:hypothetical protein